MADELELIGEVLDSKYRLEEKLGQGGMGAVFRATHLGTDRVVALKLIAPGLTEQEDFVSRFQREARAAGRLRHPNIVDLTDFGFASLHGRTLAYLVMEFLEGESLASLLQRNPTPPLPFVVEVVQQVCSALQEAHDHGIVHRDLKPENLWLEPNRRGGQTVKILDFGLAKICDPKARASASPGPVRGDEETLALSVAGKTPFQTEGEGTRLGTVLGTPAYMSPEQCRGVALDNRSDLYSLGVLVYQMLSGRPPFQGTSLDLINKHIQADVPSLRESRKNLPPGLAELVMEALSKDPAKRPASAEIFGNALEAYGTDMWATVKTGLTLYVDIFAAQWTQCLKPFVVPMLIAFLFLGFAFVMERPLGSPGALAERDMGLMITLDAITYLCPLLWLWIGWLTYASLGMKGSITPIVLRRLLQPLTPVSAEKRAEDRRAFKAYHRFNLLSAVPMTLGLTLASTLVGFTIKWRISHPNPSGSARIAWKVVASLVVLVVALVVAGIAYFGNHRFSGGGGEGMASILFLEGKALAEGRARLKQLQDRAHTHIPPSRFLDVAPKSEVEKIDKGPMDMIYGVLAAASCAFVFGGIHIWDRFLPEGARLGLWSGAGWLIIWLTALQALLAPLNGIFSALTYLRLRKIARESMREAYPGVRGAALQEGLEDRLLKPGSSPTRERADVLAHRHDRSSRRLLERKVNA